MVWYRYNKEKNQTQVKSYQTTIHVFTKVKSQEETALISILCGYTNNNIKNQKNIIQSTQTQNLET